MAVSPDAPTARGRDGERVGLIVLAVSPVVAFVVTSATGYAAPMFANPPSFLGFPIGVVLLFLATALTALALLAAARARPAAAGRVPTVAFALPAAVIVLLGPALIEFVLSR